jgi:hypothetical protein
MNRAMRPGKQSTRAARALAPLLAVCALSGSAAARDAAGAEALFRSGREALRRGDYDGACSAFEASQRLDPAAGTALNLAECEQGRAHIASAWQHLREALDLLPEGDDRIALARTRLKALEPRLPHLTIHLAPDVPRGTAVTRDDVEVKGALLGFAQPLDPGRHVIRVSAPGRADRTYEVEAVEGRASDLLVEPGEPMAAAKAHTGTSTRRKVGFIVGGFGLAATGVGVAEGVAVASRGDQKNRICPGNVCPDAARLAVARDIDSSGKTLSTLSTITTGAGIAALAVGTYLVLSGSSAERPPSITIAPSASRDGAGLGVGGVF